MAEEFDVIVVGSGMSGGYAAKELCERGLKVLVIERGRHIDHAGEEYTDMLPPWERKDYGLVSQELFDDPTWATVGYAITPDNLKWFTRFDDAPYSTEEGTDMVWVRAHGLGGRSQVWGRQTYRMGQADFDANAQDGHGVPWPIGYEDLRPWYDRVDTFVGIAGETEGLPQIPDGKFQPSFGLTAAEKLIKEKVEEAFPGRAVTAGRCAHLTDPTQEQLALGRGACQKRNYCNRGCTFGAFFSSLSATLPAAEATGNLTLVTDTLVSEIIYNPETQKAEGVRTIGAESMEAGEYRAKAVFLCASAFGSVQVLLNSRSEATPNGLGNDHDVLGRYLTDHIVGGGASGRIDGLEDRYYEGRRPNGFYIPRFRNVTEDGDGYVRGGAFQSYTSRPGPSRLAYQKGFGAEHKHKAREPGAWNVNLYGFGEMLPRWENRVTLHPTKTDKWGQPLLHFDVSISDNERAMAKQLGDDGVAILEAVGATNIVRNEQVHKPGERVHEMGGAVMGDDPAKSVTNKFNQLHAAKNVFVTDGSAFNSGGCQNPSISYMAITARAAHNCADMLAEGAL